MMFRVPPARSPPTRKRGLSRPAQLLDVTAAMAPGRWGPATASAVARGRQRPAEALRETARSLQPPPPLLKQLPVMPVLAAAPSCPAAAVVAAGAGPPCTVAAVATHSATHPQHVSTVGVAFRTGPSDVQIEPRAAETDSATAAVPSGARAAAVAKQ